MGDPINITIKLQIDYVRKGSEEKENNCPSTRIAQWADLFSECVFLFSFFACTFSQDNCVILTTVKNKKILFSLD